MARLIVHPDGRREWVLIEDPLLDQLDNGTLVLYPLTSEPNNEPTKPVKPKQPKPQLFKECA